jgi:hypothetical protein
MALTTYTELKTSIGDWLNRTDLTSAIADFISLAEAQIERQLRTRQMISRSNADINTEYAALPSDFLETKSFKLTSTNPVTPLVFQTIDALDDLSRQYSAASRPKYFGIVGGQIRLIPAPDATYTTELIYYAKLTKLSASVSSNFLLASSPDIYLYGSLLQAAPYLQDDARIPVWSSLYDRALTDVQTADDRGSTSGGAMAARARSFG